MENNNQNPDNPYTNGNSSPGGQNPYMPEQSEAPKNVYMPDQNNQNPYMPNQGANPYMPNQGQNPYMPNQGANPYIQSPGQNVYIPNQPQVQQSPYTRQQQIQQNVYIPNQPNQGAYNQNIYPPHYGYERAPSDLTPEENKRANILCVCSIIMLFIGPAFFMALSEGMGWTQSDYGYRVNNMLATLSFMGAWIMVIYVRVRYKANTFGRVLLWVYIMLMITLVVGVILFMAACNAMCRSAHC